MDNKNKFQEMLKDILEVARVQGNRLSPQEVKELFGDMELNDTQYEHIYAYLAANHIKIDGYKEQVTEYTSAVLQEEESLVNADSEDEAAEETEIKSPDFVESLKEEDSVFLKMYMEDLEVLSDSTDQEMQQLIRQIIQGDNSAKNHFVEKNLKQVVEIAGQYRNKGITLEDLIQEGNMGLLSSLEVLSELEDIDQWNDFVFGYVRSYIEDALMEQQSSKRFEDRVIEKINFINDAANELKEDLGREATMEELAACTKLSAEEIQKIVNMSSDAVKLRKQEEEHSCCDGHQHNHHHHDHHNHSH